MIIPKHIYNVLNDRSGFTALFLDHLRTSDTAEQAYLNAVDEVNKYVPFKEPYNGYDSFKSKLALDKRQEVFIPDDVALAATQGIWAVYDKMLEKYKVRKMAYDAAIVYLNKHLPNFKPYKNYQSFRNSLLYRRKNKLKTKKAKRAKK